MLTDSHLARALRVTPNASQTRSKAPGNVGPRFGPGEATDYPLFVSHAFGAHVYDNRGRRYLDCIGANAAIPLGYAHPRIAAAVTRAVSEGNLLSLPSVREASISERFLDVCAPWAELVRWVKTGSEATHAALMIARAATGRRLYLRLRGSYHGWHDCWREDAADARWLDVGQAIHDVALLSDVAAVFIEPPRWQELDIAWLGRTVSDAHYAGVVVVFDELVCGLRWANGGAAEYYGVTPDLACFGKALGNGVPVACVCGKADLMQHAALVSSTFGGDMLGLAAAEAVLTEYVERDVVAQLWCRGSAIRETFKYDAPAEVTMEGTPVHWRLCMPSEDALDRALALAAMDGVLVHRSANNASAAMTMDEAWYAGVVIGRAASEALR